jgi:hypothetical protein
MNIVIYGLDKEGFDALLHNCAHLPCTILPTENVDEATIVITDTFFDPLAYVDFLKHHKGKKIILYPHISSAIIMNAIDCLDKNASEPNVRSMPASLKARYSDSVYEKIINLDRLSQKIDETNLKNIRDEVHKIAGSAGSFGYAAMTQLSRNLEQVLNSLIEGSIKMSHEEVREMLLEYQNSLKLAFQNLLHI